MLSAAGITIVETRPNQYWYGILKTFDQFGNVVLDYCIELNINSANLSEYSEKYLGIQLFRPSAINYFGTSVAVTHQQFSEYMTKFAYDRTDNLLGRAIIGPLAKKISCAEFQACHDKYALKIKTARNEWEQYMYMMKQVPPAGNYRDLYKASLSEKLVENLDEAVDTHISQLQNCIQYISIS